MPSGRFYWQARRDGVWTVRRYRAVEEVGTECAGRVRHLGFEAEAWCRWAGRRLPSEGRIGKPPHTASPCPDGLRLARCAPALAWGDAAPTPAHANLTMPSTDRSMSPACAGGDSAFGLPQMIGNVWQWTASDFLAVRRFCRRSLHGLFATLVGTRNGAARRMLGNERANRPAGLSQFFTPDRTTSSRLPNVCVMRSVAGAQSVR